MRQHTSGPCIKPICFADDSGIEWCPLHARAAAMRKALERILNEGNYNDDGDYVLPHAESKTGEEDYLDAPALMAARALLAAIERGDHAS